MKFHVGQSVQRKPYGRICKIVEITNNKIKIQDIAVWTGWITKKTFEKNWKSF